MSERAKKLIEELKDFRTRSRAKRELVAIGDEAVDEVIALIRQRSANTTWIGIKILEEIRAARAVEVLVELLDAGVERSTSIDALKKITGKDFGSNLELWRNWLKSGRGEAGQAGTAAAFKEEAYLSDDAIVERITHGTKISKFLSGDTYTLDVPLKGGRTQKVKVLFGSKDFENEEIVTVYTECGPANASIIEWALRKNLTLHYGAFALRRMKNERTLVMVNTLLKHDLNIDELRKSIINIAEKADAVEKALTNKDLR